MVVFSTYVQAGHSHEEDPDEATEGTIRLSIPEPMYFDLVRPLGARRGEVEVNALFVKSSGQHLGWAPEVEAVVGEGIALEFELPMEGVEIETWKVAAQAKLPRGSKIARRYIHGWQAIGEIARADVPHKAAGLYISGVRWSDRVSSLSLNGVEMQAQRQRVKALPLFNNTLFFEPRAGRTFGLESNLRVQRARTGIQFLPQMHQRLFANIHLQVGVGAARGPMQPWKPVLGWRLVRELN